MVSKARDDLPEPERPVNTISRSRGIDRVTFFRLCSRAPRIVIWSVGIRTLSYSFFSGDCKRRARCGDQAPSPTLDAAFRDHRPPPGVDDTAGSPQRLSNLRGGDEAQFQVEAHRPLDARLDGAQRSAHRRFFLNANATTVHETGVVGHVFRGGHLDRRVTLAAVDQRQTEPPPGSGRGELGGVTHGPVPRAPPCSWTRRGPRDDLARQPRPPR